MKEFVSSERAEGVTPSRFDLVVFIVAFVTGVTAYIILLSLEMPQYITSAVIVSVMLTYAFVVLGVPRLRVRLDQAGDNAYYLGLLFTLVSMAVALYKFSAAAVGDLRTGAGSGTEQIIGNFGIALVSTIMGIFLRVILHQMRVDPADVEDSTRIELAEAAMRVRTSLNSIIADLSLFHDEVLQRATDVLQALTEQATQSVGELAEQVGRGTQAMLESTSGAHKDVLDQTIALTKILSEVASESKGAVERLRSVEPPTLTMSRRLDKIAQVLDLLGGRMETLVARIGDSTTSAAAAVEQMSRASAALSTLNEELARTHAAGIQSVTAAAGRVGTELGELGKKLELEREQLSGLTGESRKSVEESVRAQAAAVEVLMRLTEVARGLTAVLNKAD